MDGHSFEVLERAGSRSSGWLPAAVELRGRSSGYERIRTEARRDQGACLRTRDQAAATQRELARAGRTRVAGIADLLIAATAARAGVTVLHYDGDFDAIAEVTGQTVAWVVPRGSVP